MMLRCEIHTITYLDSRRAYPFNDDSIESISDNRGNVKQWQVGNLDGELHVDMEQ